MPTINKGQHTKLNVTEKSNHRIMAGLGWDPTADISFLEKINDVVAGKKSYHDLDLACFLFDEDYKLLNHVCVEPGKSVDHTGKIYHSGDNVEGYGEGDDEEISVELKNLDMAIQHIVFTVEVRTGHDFTEISNPEIRLADGYSDHNFIRTDLKNEQAEGKFAYAFTHLYRVEEYWNLHYLDEYLDAGNDESRIKQLKLLIQP